MFEKLKDRDHLASDNIDTANFGRDCSVDLDKKLSRVASFPLGD